MLEHVCKELLRIFTKKQQSESLLLKKVTINVSLLAGNVGYGDEYVHISLTYTNPGSCFEHKIAWVQVDEYQFCDH